MIDIFKQKQVWQENKSIPLKKLGRGMLYTLSVTAITFMINAIQSGEIPAEWVLYSGIMISILQTIKKALEKYEPLKDR